MSVRNEEDGRVFLRGHAGAASFCVSACRAHTEGGGIQNGIIISSKNFFILLLDVNTYGYC